jgi:hypothetical protein
VDAQEVINAMLPLVEDQRMPTGEAARVALDGFIKDGRGDEVLALVGVQGLMKIWNSAVNNDKQRVGLLTPSNRRQSHLASQPLPLEYDSDVFGPRKVNVTLLKTEQAILEAMLPVHGGQWKRLGSFTRRDCRHQAEMHQTRMERAETALSFWRLLGGQLKTDDVMVDQVLTAQEQVRQLALGVELVIEAA